MSSTSFLSQLYRLAIPALALSGISGLAAKPGASFQFAENDRVMLIGDTLIERELEYGALEAALTLAAGDKQVIFRNIGWSADTPAGESRTSFSPLTQGPEFLREHIALVKPTVAIIGYGMASSFDGAAGVARFTAQLQRLVALINEQAQGTAVRLIFLSPIAHEALGGRWPDPSAHNRDLAHYRDAVAAVARQSGGWHVDLSSKLKSETGPLTSNGIHLNAEGYAALARLVLGELGLANAAEAGDFTRTHPRLAALRERIAEKNRLFFHRFRPQNSMYLFLARRAEQGKNSREIPLFDPLIAAQEQQIEALLRSPLPPAATPAITEKTPAPVAVNPPSRLETLPELELTLFARTPQLTKPIAMNFDAQGRLWVAASELYPQIAPGQAATDKIFVLEDRDRDGQAEAGTVFANNLLIPTGLEPGDGGVYVGQSTELRFLKDTDGDGVADEQRVVLSGFGTEDSHHNIHTLCWGPDGHLYFSQSIYTHSHIETPHGVVRQRSGGIFRFNPKTERLSVLAHGFVNTWGHAFDHFGQSFATDGAGSEGIHYVLPGATFLTYDGLRRKMTSISPGSYPKYAGLEFVYSDHFPADWQGQLVTADFRANNVVRFSVREDGAGFASESLGRLVWSADRSFRPVDIKLGPDGALYIADWSNPVIQHGEVDFRDPSRDKVTGHIWRLAYKGRPGSPAAAAGRAPAESLFPQLLHPNDDQRRAARRLLAERGAAILPAAQAWAETVGTDEARLEALWLFEAMGQTTRPLLDTVLRSSDGRIRAAAVRLANYSIPAAEQVLPIFASSVADRHPRVRLEALRGLGRIPTLQAVDLAFGTLHQSPDRFGEYALWLTLNDLAATWTQAVEENRWAFTDRWKELNYGINAIEPRLANRVLTHALRTIPLAADGSGPWIGLIGKVGAAELQENLFARLQRREFTDEGAVEALTALLGATEHRNVQPPGDNSKLLQLPYTAEAVQIQIMKLAGVWKLPGISPILLRLAADPTRSAPLRRAALEGLRRTGAPENIAPLRDLAARRDPAIWREAIFTVLALDAAQGAPLFIDYMKASRSLDDAMEDWRELFRLRGAASAVVQELERSPLPDLPADAGLRVAHEQSDKGLALAARLQRALPAGNSALGPADIPALVANLRKGDPVRGERIYHRPELACVACHALGGVGGKVGPDLATIGTAAPADYVVEAVIAPAVKVKDGYQSMMLRTATQEISGVFEREDDTRIFLRDGAGKAVAVAKSGLLEKKRLGSMMPPGLIDRLPQQDQLDLLRFLTELGKAPFDASSRKTARVWEAYSVTDDPSPAALTALFQKAGRPVYASLDGTLRPEDLTATGLPFPLILITRFHQSTDGPGSIIFQGAARPTRAWMDTQPVRQAPGAPFEFQAGAGDHRFAIRIDFMAGPMTVRSENVTFMAP